MQPTLPLSPKLADLILEIRTTTTNLSEDHGRYLGQLLEGEAAVQSTQKGLAVLQQQIAREVNSLLSL